MPVPFKIFLSGAAGDGLRAAVLSATEPMARTAALAYARALHSAMTWIPEEFGESRGAHGLMGWPRLGNIGPMFVWYEVSVERREVTVRWFRYVHPQGA